MDINEDINLYLDDFKYEDYENTEFKFAPSSCFLNVCNYLICKRNDFKNIFHTTLEEEDMFIAFNQIFVFDKDFSDLRHFIRKIINTTFELLFCFVNYHHEDIRHTFIVIYTRHSNKVEIFEPNYNGNIFGSYDPYDKIFQLMSEQIEGLNCYKTQEIFGSFLSKQEMKKLELNNLTFHKSNTSGFCTVWCLFIFDIMTYYKDVSLSTVLEILYLRNKNLTLRQTMKNLTEMIISYMFSIYDEIETVYSENRLYLDINSFCNYDHQYVYSDKRMYEIICKFF